MTNTTRALASIDSDLLADVQGGCGRKRRRCGGCNTSTVINNNITQAAPAPAPAPAPAGTSVDVSYGYQQG